MQRYWNKFKFPDEVKHILGKVTEKVKGTISDSKWLERIRATDDLGKLDELIKSEENPFRHQVLQHMRDIAQIAIYHYLEGLGDAQDMFLKAMPPPNGAAALAYKHLTTTKIQA